jgi:ribosome biogenesis GTPase A
VDAILAKKPRVMALNKVDLADPEVTRAWLRWWEGRGASSLPIQADKGEGLRRLWETVVDLAQGLTTGQRRRLGRPVRAACVGIPIVGKSSLINSIVGKKKAQVGDRPGVTRGQQWLQVSSELELLDTPGILRPPRQDEDAYYRLATAGVIDANEYDPIAAAEWLLTWFISHKPEQLASMPAGREGLDSQATPLELLERVGRARGCLARGGTVDIERAARLFLHEYRSGKWGKFTLENPPS